MTENPMMKRSSLDIGKIVYLFVLFIMTSFACEDSQEYTFGSYNSTEKNTTITRTCSWLVDVERKDEWCDEIANGEKVGEMCPLACNNCTLVEKALILPSIISSSTEGVTESSEANAEPTLSIEEESISPSVEESIATLLPVVADIPSCCSFDNGENCVVGDFCNSNKTTCEDACSPGKWLVKSIPTPAPTQTSSATPSKMTSPCCSFNNGSSCVNGDFCNQNKTNCEEACSPGVWMVLDILTESTAEGKNETSTMPSTKPSYTPTFAPTGNPTLTPTLAPTVKPTITPTLGKSMVPSVSPSTTSTSAPSSKLSMMPSVSPSYTPTPKTTASASCCSFDNGTSCSPGAICNKSKANCEGICTPGKWVVMSKPTPTPTIMLSTMPSITPSCCSFDGGKNCGQGMFCNISKDNCEGICTPGQWVEISKPTPAPTVSSSAMPSTAPACCSFDGGQSCGQGSFCHSSKTTCEGISGCAGEWFLQSEISPEPSMAPSSLPSTLPSKSVSPTVLPSSNPVMAPSSKPSTMPTTTPSCCSFDGGATCGGGEYCNRSKINCEDESGCAGDWIVEIVPTPSPTLTLSAMPSETPSCCSFDDGSTCGGGNYCNTSKIKCEAGCQPGRWVMKPTSSPTFIPSTAPSEFPSCCSFDNGDSCGGGNYCNVSRKNCIAGCFPGKWVLKITPTASPTIAFSTAPSVTPSCCSFDSGASCGGGEFCNINEANCESSCFPGKWMAKNKPTPTPTPVPSTIPSETPSCCSFDGGVSCGGRLNCDMSEGNCESKCFGDWIKEIPTTSTPSSVVSSAMTSSVTSCCSFNGGLNCVVGDFCNQSNLNCENYCAPGKWVPLPSPALSNLVDDSNACCSWNGETCSGGIWCNSNKQNCEDKCLAKWISANASAHLKGCCSWDGGKTCSGGMWCDQNRRTCENECNGKWYFK